jgi:hypothetical protein
LFCRLARMTPEEREAFLEKERRKKEEEERVAREKAEVGCVAIQALCALASPAHLVRQAEERARNPPPAAEETKADKRKVFFVSLAVRPRHLLQRPTLMLMPLLLVAVLTEHYLQSKRAATVRDAPGGRVVDDDSDRVCFPIASGLKRAGQAPASGGEKKAGCCVVQ